jgi:hypothetical protein
MNLLFRAAVAALLAFGCSAAFAQASSDGTSPATDAGGPNTTAAATAAPVAATGTLKVDVLKFRSEVTLQRKVISQLESGAIEWGLKDDLLVFTMVNKRFIDFNIAHMTRYGTAETLQLPAGTYRITGVGLEMHTAFSPEKILAKGAYVNEDVVTFTIEPGKTTTLTIDPVIKGDNTFFLKFFMPALATTVTPEGGTPTQPRILNQREATSIAWPQYNGALKFRPQR